MQAILEKHKAAFLKKWQSDDKTTSKLSDYEILLTLGRGEFGRVLLVKLRKTERYFALKIMAKKEIIRKAAVENIISEKRILRAISFPFLVDYETHFKNNDYLFIMMGYVMGGEVFKRIQNEGALPLTQTRFYASQVLMAFEYLHHLGIMYRDLKPENVLIDHQGFVRVTDFTFAKRMGINAKTSTLCGTPEYLSPELVKQQPYSYYVDWWTMAIFIYEMYIGFPPFRSGNITTLFQLIINAKLSYPMKGQPDRSLTNLLESMLKPDWKDRLRTADTIKTHPFFKDVNWVSLYHKKVTPEYIPNVTSPTDTQNFENFEEEPLMQSDQDQFTKEFTNF